MILLPSEGQEIWEIQREYSLARSWRFLLSLDLSCSRNVCALRLCSVSLVTSVKQASEKKNEEECGDRGQLIVFLGVVLISPREYSSGWMEVSVSM